MNARDNFKWTPLHFACHAGILDVIELLLNNGADLEARTLNEATPLMRAIESAKPEVVQYLVDRGAQVRAENKKGSCFSKFYCIQYNVFSFQNTLECLAFCCRLLFILEQTPLDLSVAWADFRIYDIIKTKIDSMPPPKEKKGGKGGKGGAKGKKSASSRADKVIPRSVCCVTCCFHDTLHMMCIRQCKVGYYYIVF